MSDAATIEKTAPAAALTAVAATTTATPAVEGLEKAAQAAVPAGSEKAAPAADAATTTAADAAATTEGGKSLISGAGEKAAPAEGEGEKTAQDGDEKAAQSDAAPTPVALENLSLPEGFDAEAATQFLEIVNSDLPRAEMAQKFIDLQTSFTEKANAAATEAAQSLWDKTQADWIAKVRAMPEIGGDNLDTSLGNIKRGLIAVGADDATFAALDLTGAGSHPEVVKVLHALVQPFLERAPVPGNPPKGSLSAAERLYPTMRNKE